MAFAQPRGAAVNRAPASHSSTIPLSPSRARAVSIRNKVASSPEDIDDEDWNQDAEMDTHQALAQLRELVFSQKQRVINLLHDWDDNDDGLINRRDFHQAFSVLGLAASPRAIK